MRKDGKTIVLHNFTAKEIFLTEYLRENPEMIKNIIEEYPYPSDKKVILAKVSDRCHAEEALLNNSLEVQDLLKILQNIPRLMMDKSQGLKSHWWDSVEADICEYRISISSNREFRLFFLWKKELIFLNTGRGEKKSPGNSFPPLALLPSSQRAEDGHPSDKAEKLHHQHAGQNTDAVDAHVLFGRSASGYKGLVVFVQRGEAHAESPGKDWKPKSPDPIYIERKGDGDCQQKIFCHMRQLPHRIMDLSYVVFDIASGPVEFKRFICRFHDDLADLIA